MAWVNRLRPEQMERYIALHEDAWPEVLDTITACNIRNYSIFLRKPEGLLFGYFEYHGKDYAEDMKKMASDATTLAWWQVTDPCQQPLDSVSEGESWAPMTEVFYHE